MDSGSRPTQRLLWLASMDLHAAPCPEGPWEWQRADSLRRGEQILEEQRILVGIFLLARKDLVTLPHLEAFLRRHCQVEWVALVDPELLWEPRVRELLGHWCYDFHSTPVDPNRLRVILGHALGMARLLTRGEPGPLPGQAGGMLVGESPVMRQVLRTITKVGRVDAPVLITGESGTGKELAARAVHDASPRASGPFEAINCAAVPAALVQSELFGHERGAFTGAHRARQGHVCRADGGTLFLDEIGDLPLEVQSTLLRFLQNQTVQRIGSDREEKVDVRVVAATHVDLEAAVREGRFREDLFYRLDVLRFQMPPLRERDADAVLLARHFYQTFSRERGHRVKGFSAAGLESIRLHRWPGNVRELINRVRRAMVLCESRYIQPWDLGLEEVLEAPANLRPLEEVRADAEREAITRALALHQGNVSAAARHLEVSRITLYRMARRHGIPIPGPRGGDGAVP
ncbi:DNA-binding transcriptional response regulator, NtrC family, contains REC, AAA-type ATPase, and a Fis-type DNA-binding domains [Ectothiorhodospira mobilis]|uniref:DNA-binding transcriptional response regulator, NtrC family, contains REC, AAA-type ATPase, and a Fis-type DNA-binding domains n=1 Tax=Ectothiorhodospira mobilis TaxID=195064 RepID=A0A1I4S5P3_ECTMO|nr:sigma-54 dependent transcriptional regulator [Ectothiorhodospira mobilis]SFM59691.1 DNA-binding transcriptional response regulator, NtrC family, contains REC, AAA-type ATPase, and a Fis-type DNA-binding domains [Ectothiorhodospira mobilis]